MKRRRSPLRPDGQVRAHEQKGRRPKRDRRLGQQRLVRQAGLRHLGAATKTRRTALQLAPVDADAWMTWREEPRETQRFDERTDSAGSHGVVGPDRIGRLRAPLRPAGALCPAGPGLGPHGRPDRSSSLPRASRSRSGVARARVRPPRCKLLLSARRARRTGPEAVRRSDPPHVRVLGCAGDWGGSYRLELRSLLAPAWFRWLALSAPESTPFELIFSPFRLRPVRAQARS
jgi:hypothetical protein